MSEATTYQQQPRTHVSDPVNPSPSPMNPRPEALNQVSHRFKPYRGAWLVKKRNPLGPFRRPMPRVLGWS